MDHCPKCNKESCGACRLTPALRNSPGRERVLRELAKRMAERVETSRQPITLEAMPPNERRIVHISLRDHPNVRTNSIGEGEHRRVMILHK